MENHLSLQQKIAALIRGNKTDEVFKMLRHEKLSASKVNALTIIEAAYNEVKQAELKGLSSAEEIQIRKNKINNQLLELFNNGTVFTKQSTSKFKYLSILAVALLVLSSLWWFFNSSDTSCPSYNPDINNKILVLPFQNVGNTPAKPEVSINKRINELTSKNNLSSESQLAKNTAGDLSNSQVIELGKNCNLDLLIWGTYSSRSDSLRLVLEYHFTKKPTAKNLSELITLKDVTGLQKGRMLKSLDDVILSLCGLIALREGNKDLAMKWFEKVKEKDKLDEMLLEEMK